MQKGGRGGGGLQGRSINEPTYLEQSIISEPWGFDKSSYNYAEVMRRERLAEEPLQLQAYLLPAKPHRQRLQCDQSAILHGILHGQI